MRLWNLPACCDGHRSFVSRADTFVHLACCRGIRTVRIGLNWTSLIMTRLFFRLTSLPVEITRSCRVRTQQTREHDVILHTLQAIEWVRAFVWIYIRRKTACPTAAEMPPVHTICDSGTRGPRQAQSHCLKIFFHRKTAACYVTLFFWQHNTYRLGSQRIFYRSKQTVQSVECNALNFAYEL